MVSSFLVIVVAVTPIQASGEYSIMLRTLSLEDDSDVLRTNEVSHSPQNTKFLICSRSHRIYVVISVGTVVNSNLRILIIGYSTIFFSRTQHKTAR